MAKRSSGNGLWLLVAAIIVIAAVPREVWIGIGVFAGLGVLAYVLVKHVRVPPAVRTPLEASVDDAPTLAELTRRTPATQPARTPQRTASTPVPPQAGPTTRPATPPVTPPPQPADAFYRAPAPADTPKPSYVIPKPPAGFGDGRWIPPGEAVEVAGVTLPGGMLYIGGRLRAPNGITDPCLISGHLNVARAGDYRSRQMGYWPSYADASPHARRAYLNWLSEGRSHPDCDIGYVFLFFYGLERRVIVDSREDPSAREDWPAIVAELRRLLGIYGEKSGSFKRYAGELVSWIELDGASGQLYKQPVPDLPKTYELPPYLRLALGQAAVDRAPVPAALALAWVQLSPETYLRTAATRCPGEFGRLFMQRYQDAFGAGLVLPKNRTKLKFVYQAASAGLRGANITLGFGDIPDVTALTAPIKQLGEIAHQCTDELGSYSRLVGKDPAAARGLDGLLLLPATLWPAAAQTKLRALTSRMTQGYLTLPVQDLFDALGGATTPVNRDRVRGLARALEGVEIGLEPHVLGGARPPAGQDAVVMFSRPVQDALVGTGAEYQTAALTLQLAAAVAQADGDFNDAEMAHLRAEIAGWAHLVPAEQRRLQAHLQWLAAAPPTVASLKKKLEPLTLAARETLATFMVTLAQSDGFVSPDEVKFLEKIYKALGVDPKRVFSDVHAVGVGGAPVTATQAETTGFRLDAARIAALQEDTARVSALLSKIFTEEAPNVPAPLPAAAPEAEPEDALPSPLGLDEAHAALVRLLLSRPEWARSELEDAAADLDLMLDGALEQINEAAFDTFDEPLCEGDDPLTVNTDLLEKIEA